MTSRIAVSTLAIFTILVSPAAAQVENWTPVTDAVLQDPPAEDWLNWRRTLNGQAHSPLDAPRTMWVTCGSSGAGRSGPARSRRRRS